MRWSSIRGALPNAQPSRTVPPKGVIVATIAALLQGRKRRSRKRSGSLRRCKARAGVSALLGAIGGHREPGSPSRVGGGGGGLFRRVELVQEGPPHLEVEVPVLAVLARVGLRRQGVPVARSRVQLLVPDVPGSCTADVDLLLPLLLATLPVHRRLLRYRRRRRDGDRLEGHFARTL